MEGTVIKGDWSPHITIRDVICTLRSGDRIFFGVLAEKQESRLWTWLESDLLLWVFDDGQCIREWQECAQRPHMFEGHSSYVPESIVGHHEAANGEVLYGVKWVGYGCPTWELESDLWMHGYLLAAYHDTIQTKVPTEAFVVVGT